MRIAIVNDLRLAVEAIRRVIQSVPGHQVAWIAHDGVEAVEKSGSDTPDLILMDLIMPRMDGVEATRQIMARNPCAIVVVTADMNRNSAKVFEAMGAGALDAVDTPAMDTSDHRRGARSLLGKIETIRRLIRPLKPRIFSPKGQARKDQMAEIRCQTPAQTNWLVVMGASAGGPTALAEILGCLPADFPSPIVVVQHVDAQFAGGLSDWLGSRTPLSVRLASEGDLPRPGCVLLPGRDSHLVLASSTRIGYTRNPVDCSYRPSVDVFFKSVDRHWRGPVLAVLLTGMGRDGAEGLRQLKVSGHHTVAQDQASSAVYGMPKAAADLEAATEILALDKIGPRLRNIVSGQKDTHA